ncbi:MAG: cysteine--tRNA ligase, partial [Paracoccaceae bacterium]|nr:cysteine--tRNA ligase [Paracoccaceae bacterium]
GWHSPWGRGRPGWHIECSAMSHELLGDTFDIHGGGNDLMFPHHENEIAQSTCAHPEARFARYWLHNEMLQVEGKKMSKSLGNFFTVRDLLETGMPGGQGVPGEVIRYVFLQTHYRKPMDWRQIIAISAKQRLDIWASEIASSHWIRQEMSADLDAFVQKHVDPEVVSALADDLNTSKALTHLIAVGKTLEGLPRAGLSSEEVGSLQRRLLAGCALLGIDLFAYWDQEESKTADLTDLKQKLVTLRETAMQTKDFSAVDALKSALIDAGVEVRMSKAGVELVPGAAFDAAKLESL